jgi:hypothetical protein
MHQNPADSKERDASLLVFPVDYTSGVDQFRFFSFKRELRRIVKNQHVPVRSGETIMRRLKVTG